MIDINGMQEVGSTLVQSVVASQAREVKSYLPPADNPSVAPTASVTGEGINIDNVDPKVIDKIVSDLGTVLTNLNVELNLQIDDDSKRIVVKVIDPNTREVIKQIPSKEMITIGKRVDELLSKYSPSNNNANVFEDIK